MKGHRDVRDGREGSSSKGSEERIGEYVRLIFAGVSEVARSEIAATLGKEGISELDISELQAGEFVVLYTKHRKRSSVYTFAVVSRGEPKLIGLECIATREGKVTTIPIYPDRLEAGQNWEIVFLGTTKNSARDIGRIRKNGIFHIKLKPEAQEEG